MKLGGELLFMKLKKFDQNIIATDSLIQRYENKKEEIKMRPYKNSHFYLSVFTGTVAGMFIASASTLDSGAMIIGGMAGGLISTSIPYVIRQIKLGDLNYQIYMNNLILNDLDKKREKILNLKK